MGVNVAGAGFNFVGHIDHHSCNFFRALPLGVSSTGQRNGRISCDRKWRSSLFGTLSNDLYRSKSLEIRKLNKQTVCSASSEDLSDDEFSQMVHELALRFQYSVDDDTESISNVDESGMILDSVDMGKGIINQASNSFQEDSRIEFIPPPWLGNLQGWSPGEEIIPACIQWKAACVDLPLSLRIIQRKKQWREGVKEVGESAYCSVKKAFSSMVFIIRELHSYSLQMRELIQFQDLQGILSRVQMELHASFVWLFQQVFSPTPTLMVYVMMLLANYTVYSMGNSVAVSTVSYLSSSTECVSFAEEDNKYDSKFDSSILKGFSVDSPSGGGGGKFKHIASGSEGEDIFPDGSFHASMTQSASTEDMSSKLSDEEMKLWNSILDESVEMQKEFRDVVLDHDTDKIFVSPVTATVIEDDYTDYLGTELLYKASIARDPSNPLLLANYAQYLYVVAREFERAEYYFKKATSIEPHDAEAFDKYAMFLWKVNNDLWGAEETYLEAISADPSNSHYKANYAHFLWKTGAEDTCYPLECSPDESITNNA